MLSNVTVTAYFNKFILLGKCECQLGWQEEYNWTGAVTQSPETYY